MVVNESDQCSRMHVTMGKNGYRVGSLSFTTFTPFYMLVSVAQQSLKELAMSCSM